MTANDGIHPGVPAGDPGAVATALLELSPHQQSAAMAALRASRRDATQPGAREPEHPAMTGEQRQIWFGERSRPGVGAYNIHLGAWFSGEMDDSQLVEAVVATIGSHAILRTEFPEFNGEPVAQPCPPLSRDDIRVETAAASETAALDQATAFVSEPFELERGPLVRAGIWCLARHRRLLVIAAHHIVCDGRSLDILVREMSERYEGKHRDNGTTAAADPVGVITRQDHLEELARQQETIPPVLDLPGDAPSGADPALTGGVCSRAVPTSLVQQLDKRARERNVTPTAVLLSTLAALVYRYTNQGRFSIGVPFTTRRMESEGDAVGLFVNSLPVPFHCSPGSTFIELIETTQRALARRTGLARYVHFEQLVQRINPPRDLSRNPLYQVEFAFMPRRDVPTSIGGAQLAIVAIPGGFSKFDLTMDVTDSESGLSIRLEYSRRFSASRMERMIGHYLRLLHHAVTTPESTLGTHSLLTESEADWMRRSGQLDDPDNPSHEALIARLRRHTASAPDQAAVEDPSESVTYRELLTRAERAADVLATLGVEPGSRVALHMARSAQAVVAALAAWMRGAAFVPIDEDEPKGRVDRILDSARPVAIVVDDNTIARLGDRSEVLVRADYIAGPTGVFFETPTGRHDPEAPAYVIFTSGTTGEPKAVEVTHRALETMTTAWASEFNLEVEPPRYLQLARMSFDIFVGDLCRSFLCGGTLVICPRETATNPEDLLALMDSSRIDTVEFVPSHLRFLLDYLGEKGRRLPPLRRLVVGSDMWTTGEAMRTLGMVRAGTQLLCSYGTSEAAVDSTYAQVTPEGLAGHSAVPIGRPFPGVGARVLDAAGHDCPIGVPGELALVGPTVSKGYLFAADAEKSRFTLRSRGRAVTEFNTRDRAYWTEDGELVCLGRADDLVKVHGARVDLVEVEGLLRTVSGVIDAAVVAIGPPGDQQLAAIIVPADGTSDAASTARNQLSENLQSSAIPTTWITTDQLPTNPNGKLDRAALLTIAQSEDAPCTVDRARTGLEQDLHQIWRDVLERDNFGVTDNFFQIGGRSLLAAKCAWRIRERLGIAATMADIFAAQTIQVLAERLERSEDRVEPPAAVVAPKLPQDIVFPGAAVPAVGRRRVFVTGSTGLVGSVVTRMLMNSGFDVTRLVRADPRGGAALTPRDEAVAARRNADFVVGDLSQPRLALASDRLAAVAESIDAVVNVAAWVNFVLPYHTLAPTNVDGVVELLRLCCLQADRSLPLVHFSAISALGTGDAVPPGGYNATKWAADRLIESARRRGLPATTIQPGFVADPDRARETDLLWAFLASCCHVGKAPELHGHLNIVSAECLGQAVVASLRGTLDTGVWIAAHPDPAAWTEVFDAIRCEVAPLETVSSDHWLDSVRRPGLPLEPFLHLIEEVGLAELLQDDEMHLHSNILPAVSKGPPVVELVVKSLTQMRDRPTWAA